ncbi:galactokinase [Ceraceosorus bombacis]|uniref:Galactokinase n=1 Tax=Ceraceosorus bombacis TaxID=401625 RepID=A0A0P1B8R0_9BASI|nr:galactokinase [Ceraceosorus bombacis]
MASQSVDPVPLVPALANIYSPERVVPEGQRWDALTSKFGEAFGHKPTYVARAPGRVNIIGEHIDHMGFGVLPAALEMDILMAFRVSPATSSTDKLSFHLRNTTPRFEATSFESDVKDPTEVQLQHEGASRWANYFKVAFKGLHPHLPPAVLSAASRPARVEVLVDGTIPPESSLSSSAAMTVCSSIVILEAFKAREIISRREMAEVAIESERLVGVASGGMDQSASIFGTPGSALHITFHPSLAVQAIELPKSDPPHTFVVANTLIVSDKKVSGPVQYNLRVGELRMAARALSAALGLPKDGSTQTLRKLLAVYFERNALPGQGENKLVDEVKNRFGEEAAQIAFLGAKADEILPKEPLTRGQVEQLTGYAGAAFDKEFLSEFPIRADTFKLHARTRHVFAESLRVLQFKAACVASPTASTYEELGKLMDQSQESLMSDYENGCPEILDVVRIARANGSLGSRATGAGWGGSTVHLVRQDKVNDVLSALREDFYAQRFPELGTTQVNQSLLVSQPAGGACVYAVEA